MMAKNISAIFSFITILLSLFFFVLPALVGNSVLVAFFLISFVLLIIAFISSMYGLTDETRKYSGLGLFSLIVSIVFIIFLLIGALIQI